MMKAHIAAILLLGLGTAHAAFADDGLYQTLGGKEGLAKIAHATTDQLLADDRIKDAFANTDMDRFRTLLADQYCAIAGGPCDDNSRAMTDAHKELHLTNLEFNAMLEDLQIAMYIQGIPYHARNRFVARLMPMERDVVAR